MVMLFANRSNNFLSYKYRYCSNSNSTISLGDKTMNDDHKVLLIVGGVIGLLAVGVYFLSAWTENIYNERIAVIDEDFECNKAYIYYLESEYRVVKQHIITKVFKECLT